MEPGKRGYGSIMFNPYLVGGLEHVFICPQYISMDWFKGKF